MTEVWRRIEGHEDYEVSDLGRIRSWVPWRDLPIPHILKGAMDTGGYPTVVIRGRSFGAHRLVALTFIGPKPEGQEIRHLNGNSADPRLVNLAYGTKSENMRDRVRHGTHQGANKTHCVNGHEFTPENTMLERQGAKRSWRTCKRAHWRKWAERRRAS